MWEALDGAGCEPKGDVHDFNSYCPAHQGRTTRNLGVIEGADGRVVLNCLAGCDWRAIVSALGLDGRALFPIGHRNGPRAVPRPVKSLSKGAAFMDALTGAGFRWAAMVPMRCPYCGVGDAYLTVHDAGGLDVTCSEGCVEDEVRRAVETRAAIAEKGFDLA